MSSEHHQATGNFNTFNVLTSHNNVVNFITETDLEGGSNFPLAIATGTTAKAQGVRTSRLDGIGNWTLETNEFRKWSGKENGSVEPVLFSYENPGVGKTYLR